MKPVFDSGDDLGSLCANLFPWAFNAIAPEKFCIDNQYKQDVNVDARNYFEWMTLPGRGKPAKPLREVRSVAHCWKMSSLGVYFSCWVSCSQYGYCGRTSKMFVFNILAENFVGNTAIPGFSLFH